MAHRFQHIPKYAGTTRPGGGWSGQINFDEKALLIPLKRKKPTVYFVNSMSDLFHENVEEEWIDRIFGIMAGSPRHRFLILTKRPERMRGYCKNIPCAQEILPNVALGVSVENQATADERIPLLLETPTAMRFVSYEPAIGAVDLSAIDVGGWHVVEPLTGRWIDEARGEGHVHGKLDWTIAGGESGPGARPAHPGWFRSVRDQCADAGVAFHFKQWGEWVSGRHYSDSESYGYVRTDQGDVFDLDAMISKDDCGGEIVEKWSEKNLRATSQSVGWCDPVTTYSGDCMVRVGKKITGRLLEGVEHLDRPEWFFQGGQQ